ncbi:hypothetical protein V9T40_014764 [Parthenolecanium corni]|uniref:DE-cadherin n=1 Tax=Parthenolecanium corni TaxID=536013 RepID=A0AAN9XX26_9HEMI
MMYAQCLGVCEIGVDTRGREGKDLRPASKVNENHFPEFRNCSNYQPRIKEEEPTGTPVITVHAFDPDEGKAGTITYLFIADSPEQSKFHINPNTGEITTKYMFNRDEPFREKEINVIVRATDDGAPKLEAICLFTVTIEDINDNAPTFDKVSYKESIPKDKKVGSEVMRISATDIDDGLNKEIVYSLSGTGDDYSYFDIDPNTGAVKLKKEISKPTGYIFKIQASATDKNPTEPRSSLVELEIKVIESDKLAPTFDGELPPPVIPLLENETSVIKNIAILRAKSNTEEAAPLFQLVSGKYEEANSRDTFVLKTNAKKDTAYIRYGGSVPLDYEVLKEYTLTVRIENKHSLAATHSFKIRLIDVNDNAPKFKKGATSGQVLENERPGTVVMKVQAIDEDETPEFKKITYELQDLTDLFEIHPETGVITTKKEFDREEKESYNVKVIAKDGAPSAILNNGDPNTGEQVFRIDIADKNDHSPQFEKEKFSAVISEDADVGSNVIELKATDIDAASQIVYSFDSGNEDGAFEIVPETGLIKTKKALDFEKKTNYVLEVKADDGLFNAKCSVEIKITNVNDEYPQFTKMHQEARIVEGDLVSGCIATVEAHDPDVLVGEDQRIVYSLLNNELKEFFRIDTNGCLSLVKPLDRDRPKGREQWQVLIKANDDGGDPTTTKSNVATVMIFVSDVNDNAPILDMPEPVVWRENTPLAKITKLKAIDMDGPDNGAPFTFKLADGASDDIREKFNVVGDYLEARDYFDREVQKFYDVPISISDSGSPTMTGISNLTVIIGDDNDNPMKDGSSSIFVYHLQNSDHDMVIGRVYVEDPDDWDLPDKSFQWEVFNDRPESFSLNEQTGDITMSSKVVGQTYNLRFKVTEDPQSRKFNRHTKTATVEVTVKDIPEEAVRKSGSIRFEGVTAEQFVEKDKDGRSRADKLKTLLADAFNNTEENIDVFTIMYSPVHENTNYLDVRFSAHGSPYYAPEKINKAVVENQDLIKNQLDAKIRMVNIDECLVEKEKCEASCSNVLEILNAPAKVSTNTTSFVGISAFVNASCDCKIEHVTCYNGGTQNPEGTGCTCPEGSFGLNCEQSTISFSGEGWALYPKWEACNETRIVLYIQTSESNGLIFYLGPESVEPVYPFSEDFVALKVDGGTLTLQVDYGSGTLQIEHFPIKVDDNVWHKVEIILSPVNIQLIVDNCNTKQCLFLKPPKGDNQYVNVNGPLQLGGTYMNLKDVSLRRNWLFKPTTSGFVGCIQNFTVNGNPYNLASPSFHQNLQLQCLSSPPAAAFVLNKTFLLTILICLVVLALLFMAVVVHRRKVEDMYKDTDDIRENIINYEDEGGGEGDMTGFDMNVLRLQCDEPMVGKYMNGMLPSIGHDEVPDICGFLDDKKHSVDNDPETLPFDDVRHYAYEGDGNTSGSLSSLASGTDEGDLNFEYLSNFGPRFRKLADMYGEDASDEDSDYPHDHTTSESWC